jgi:hypothetical protein
MPPTRPKLSLFSYFVSFRQLQLEAYEPSTVRFILLNQKKVTEEVIFVSKVLRTKCITYI